MTKVETFKVTDATEKDRIEYANRSSNVKPGYSVVPDHAIVQCLRDGLKDEKQPRKFIPMPDDHKFNLLKVRIQTSRIWQHVARNGEGE